MRESPSKALTPFDQAWLSSRKSIQKLLRSDPRSRQASGCSKAKQEPTDVLALLDKLKEMHELVEQQLADERRHAEFQARDKDAAEGLLKGVEDEMQRWKEVAERAEEALTLIVREAARIDNELMEARGQLAETQQRLQSAQLLVARGIADPPARGPFSNPEEAGMTRRGQNPVRHSQDQRGAGGLAARAAGAGARSSYHAQAASVAQSARERDDRRGEAAGDAVPAGASRHATNAALPLPAGVREEGRRAGGGNRTAEGSTSSVASAGNRFHESMVASLQGILFRAIFSMEKEVDALKEERQELIVMVAMLTRQLREAEARGGVDDPTFKAPSKC